MPPNKSVARKEAGAKSTFVHCILSRWRRGIAHCATVSADPSTAIPQRCKRWRFWTFFFGAAAARARVPLTQSLSQVGVTEVRVSHDRVSTQTGALLDSLPLFAFAHLFPLLLSQVTLFAVFFFILVLNLAYMLMGIGQYTFEPGNLPRFRAHLNAVVFSRFALIALLASFVALMRCDPVGAEEEVRSIEPSLTHVILALRILVYLTLVSEAHALRLVRPPSAAGQ